MRDIDLPNPNVGTRGFHLRRAAAKAISSLAVEADHYGGKHPDAGSVKAFFDACAEAAAALVPTAE